MNASFNLNTLLVPVDFSPASQAALGHAMSLALGEKPVVILLHVIDPSLVSFAANHGWGSEVDILAQMRRRAEQQLESYREDAMDDVEIETIVSEGVPFLEILRESEDFAVDAIVIGKIGTHGAIEHDSIVAFALGVQTSADSGDGLAEDRWRNVLGGLVKE